MAKYRIVKNGLDEYIVQYVYFINDDGSPAWWAHNSTSYKTFEDAKKYLDTVTKKKQIQVVYEE